MQQYTPRQYLNLTKKEFTKKYRRDGFGYEKLLKEVQSSFGISGRNYYAIYYYSNARSQRYLRNRKEFEEFMAGEEGDQLFIERREEGEDVLQDSGRDSNKVTLYNQSLQKALDGLKGEHSQSIKNLQEEIKNYVNLKLLKKSQILKASQSRRIKSSLKEWRDDCLYCKKAIKGVKYECASCDYIYCEKCERDHPYHEISRSHVFIKIYDEEHQIKKKYLKNKQQRRKLVLEKQQLKPSNDNINLLSDVLSISREKATQLIRQHPGKDVNQIIEIYIK